MKLNDIKINLLEQALNAGDNGIDSPDDQDSDEYRVFDILVETGMLEPQMGHDGGKLRGPVWMQTVITEKGRLMYQKARYDANSLQYQNDALVTLSTVKPDISMQLLHGALGLCTEVGELQDAIKRMFYGKTLDAENIIEELGDLEWYMAAIRDALDVTQAEVQARNIIKLKTRYAEKFTEQEAIERRDKNNG